MPIAVSASGARYADDAGNEFWTKGDSGTLLLAGEEQRKCSLAEGASPWETARARNVAFRAVGNEPGWYLELTPGKTVEVVADYGERKASLPAPESFEAAESKALSLKSGSHALAFAVEKKTCSDGMSDAVYPYAVKMTLDGRDYAGCGRAL